jgi:hypothetical protein
MKGRKAINDGLMAKGSAGGVLAPAKVATKLANQSLDPLPIRCLGEGMRNDQNLYLERCSVRIVIQTNLVADLRIANGVNHGKDGPPKR